MHLIGNGKDFPGQVFVLLFALRNVKRHIRRSFLTFFLVLFSSFLITALRFMAYGMHQEMLKNAVSLSSGFLQIAAHGWLENRSIERSLDAPPGFLSSLKVPGVQAVSPRITGYALAAHGQESAIISVFAANHAQEEKITNIHAYPIKGAFLQALPGDRGKTREGYTIFNVVIGRTLANNLEAKLGSEISLVTGQFDGSVGAVLGRVVGILKIHDLEIAGARAYISLAGGRELFGLHTRADGLERYTNIALGVSDYLAAKRVHDVLIKKFPPPVLKPNETPQDSTNYAPVMHLWKDLIPGLVQLLEFDDIQNNASWAFLIMVMAIGILITVQMSIQERNREFAVMMAIGAEHYYIIRLILTETLLIFLPGIILGGLIGTGVGYYMQENPIALPSEVTDAYASMGMQALSISAIVNFEQLWIALASLFFPSIFLTLLATRRIFKINPAEAIVTY